MKLPEEKASISLLQTVEEKILWKITALWGFSEAALGGVLHGFKVPFRGMFVASAAIIFITLIAYYSKKKGSILHATIIVIIIKGVVSPHTPVTAYFAVFLQGLLGETFFYSHKMFRTSALLLGVSVMLTSAFQRIFILTVLFGQTLWISIDEFASFILNQFLLGEANRFNFSFSVLLISLYAAIHFAAGIIVGILAGKFPQRMNEVNTVKNLSAFRFNNDSESASQLSRNKQKKKWWRKKSGLALILFSVLFVITSYIFPEFGKNKIWAIVIMLVRSVVIISLWFFIIAPFILKLINKFLIKKQSQYSKDILEMIELFPYFRQAVKVSWKSSSTSKGLKRLNIFLVELFALILLKDIVQDE